MPFQGSEESHAVCDAAPSRKSYCLISKNKLNTLDITLPGDLTLIVETDGQWNALYPPILALQSEFLL
jgi:hypothetical protein